LIQFRTILAASKPKTACLGSRARGEEENQTGIMYRKCDEAGGGIEKGRTLTIGGRSKHGSKTLTEKGEERE